MPSPPLGDEPKLVLVADDCEDTRDLYRQLLTHYGYRVAEAADGHELIARAAALNPAVVVLDLGLPKLDGWLATERLAADPLTRSIPVVVVSGHAQAEARERAMAAGCAAFLVKPCEPARLLQTIEQFAGQA